jgi:hypothetical protein
MNVRTFFALNAYTNGVNQTVFALIAGKVSAKLWFFKYWL